MALLEDFPVICPPADEERSKVGNDGNRDVKNRGNVLAIGVIDVRPFQVVLRRISDPPTPGTQ
jgi:hypothetical protein